MSAAPYVNQSPVYTRSPQPPPSPPGDDPDSLRKLPSIQSLIGMDRPSVGQEKRGMLKNFVRSTRSIESCAAHTEEQRQGNILGQLR